MTCPARPRWLVRAAALCAFVLLLAGLRVPAQSQAPASQALADHTARPNIVLFLSDDHGIDYVGCYGNPAVRTPNIDALARQGMRFDRVFGASPTCSPSRAAIFTGLWPQRNGTMGNHTDCHPGLKSLPDYLRPLGYRVVAVNKTDVRPKSVFDWEYLRATLPTDPKFRRYRDEGLDTAKVDAFLAQHVREHPGQPLCLLLGDNGPHVVWETNKIYDPSALPMNPLLVDTPKTRLALANYYQDITTTDARLGQVLASLKRYGLADNTLFIYTTDQGAEWPRCKWTCYDSGLRVPFIVRWPGVVKPGTESDALLSLIDLTPTFVTVAGGQAPQGIDGISFEDLLLGRTDTGRKLLFSTHTGDGMMNRFPQRGVRDARYDYILNLHPERDWTTHFTKVTGIHNSHAEVWNTWVAQAKADPAAAHLVNLIVHHPAEELYDTQTDPYELTNLVSRPGLKPVLERLRGQLTAWRRQVGDLPAATRPNILFAIADDMGHASAYGTPWVHTPNFDRLAASGILFLNAYTPDAKCSPSRSCILTGRNPWQNEAAANHWPYYPTKFKSWMEALGDAGYDIGFTGKGWAPGTLPPERRNITGTAWQKRHSRKPTTGIAPNDYFANFRDFLDACPTNQPFCFWYGCHEPHRPYEYGTGVRKGGYHLSDIDHVPSYWPDTEAVRNDMLDYAFEIAHYDAQLGKMVALLKERGLLTNTIIVATSDNGPPFPRLKGHPFEQACHLPLAIMWPAGITDPGRKCAALVSFIDFAPTFLELGGVARDESGMQPVTGRSFVDLLRNQQPAVDRSSLIMGRERNDRDARPGTESGLGYPVRAIRSGNLLYLHNFEPSRWPCGNPELGLKDTDNGPTKQVIEAMGTNSADWQLCFGMRPADELYDLGADPECVRNLAAKPEYQPKVNALHEQLFNQLKQQHDPRMLGQGDIFDNYPSPMRPRPRPQRKLNVE